MFNAPSVIYKRRRRADGRVYALYADISQL